MRILYIQPGLAPPASNRFNQMFYVGEPVCGDVLYPTWYREEAQIHAALGEGSYPEHKVGNFTFHICLAGKYRVGHPLQKLLILWFFLRQGLHLVRKHKYDCIISYGFTLTGIAAYILRWVSGAKLIVEFGNAPHQYNQFGRFNSTPVTFGMRMAKRASDMLLNVIAGSADRVILRYPTQLEHYPRVQKVPASIVHGFRPVSTIPFTGKSENYILLVGAPWYLKGVDLLIEAFHKIKAEFPDVTLRALGHYPDREVLDQLIAGEPRIELMKARKNHEALRIIGNSLIFVLASRTEAQGRVLLEAMATGKPIVASSADGIPYYVQDNVNGLVFEKENADDLADKLRTLLRSPELRRRLGDKGFELVHSKYSEAQFGENLKNAVELTVRGGNVTSVSGQDRSAPVGTL
jgi:glycosyltransferase involved in cell wall biosynthesis